MEIDTQTKNITGEPEHITDLVSLNRIGVESELSKYPIYNLSKKGKVNIEIKKRGVDGHLDLKWEVSYNDRYGQARQLAYKLQSLVIDRRIDEEGRPIPKIIRLGSLRDIADRLDLGGDTNKVRAALRQNVGVIISAKIKWKTNSGTERWLEADFSRYSVVFTGEKLPDGSEADAVYLILNDPYRDVLNDAPVRPLDYDYLKDLAPSAQRFYEIMSRYFYTAIKYSHPHAKILFSDYCAYSAQQRYFELWKVKRQMNPTFRPHFKSGYLKDVRYEETIDVDGKPDWIMYFTVGPKAYTEFAIFTGRKLRVIETKIIEYEATGDQQATKQPKKYAASRQRSLNLRPEEKPVDPHLLSELVNNGIIEPQARKILLGLSPNQNIQDQLEYALSLIATAPTSRPIQNRGAFLFDVLSKNPMIPDNFETSTKRKARLEALATEETARKAKLQAEQKAEEDQQRKAQEKLTALSPEQYQALYEESKRKILEGTPWLLKHQNSSILDVSIQASMLAQLERQPKDPPEEPRPQPESIEPQTTKNPDFPEGPNPDIPIPDPLMPEQPAPEDQFNPENKTQQVDEKTDEKLAEQGIGENQNLEQHPAVTQQNVFPVIEDPTGTGLSGSGSTQQQTPGQPQSSSKTPPDETHLL